jgi:hypothetical protein
MLTHYDGHVGQDVLRNGKKGNNFLKSFKVSQIMLHV